MINLLATKTSSPLAALLLLAALLGCEDSGSVWVEGDQTVEDSAADCTRRNRPPFCTYRKLCLGIR